MLSTLVVTAGWALLVKTGSISTIWPMFGIANQLLAVVALALITTLLINSGKARYAPVTALPMLFVIATTMTAGAQMIGNQFWPKLRSPEVAIVTPEQYAAVMNIALTVFVMACVSMLLLLAASRWVAVISGMVPLKSEAAV
jgi:carbon starvation protein